MTKKSIHVWFFFTSCLAFFTTSIYGQIPPPLSGGDDKLELYKECTDFFGNTSDYTWTLEFDNCNELHLNYRVLPSSTIQANPVYFSGANSFFNGQLRSNNLIYTSGNIGINTLSPIEALQISNGFAMSNGYLVTGNSSLKSSWNVPWYGLSLVQEADLDLDGDNSGSNPIVLQSFYGLGFRTSSGFMGMDSHGIVSIGLDGDDMFSLAQETDASSPYKLYVKSGIRTEEVLIDVKNNWWPDYVFENDYELSPLSEVEAFIQQHKHLPDVPSAKTVEENGVQIAEMNATLLRKVEELTLYVIELEKKVKNLEKK